MRHLDLFSGIGGFALATEMVWDTVEHVFCDNDLFCQEVLKKHWHDSKIYGDIKEIKKTEEIFDLLTGGFPCQPFSQAGRRRGTEDDRHLWPEMLRVIREFHPRWIVGENVSGLVTWNDGMVLEQIHVELESEGYEVQSFVIPACAVNAPHRRDRVWIIAHCNGTGRKVEGLLRERGLGDRRSDTDVADTIGSEHRGRRLSEGEEEGVPRVSGETRHIRRSSGTDKVSKDTISKRRGRRMESDRQILERRRAEVEDARSGWSENWIEVATRLCRMDDGISKRLDRNPRLKALGNAIVPQVVAEIFKVIKEIDETHSA